ncbi:mCG148108 [Mus musculus]|nr:mCG148108 [Mus musculus]
MFLFHSSYFPDVILLTGKKGYVKGPFLSPSNCLLVIMKAS